MTTTKTDRRFRKRYILRNIILIVPPLVAFLLIWFNPGSIDFNFWLATVFIVAWIAAWIVWDIKMLRNYSCPSCKHTIGKASIQDRVGGDPIRFYCPNCDIEWDTGLRETDD